MSTKTVSQQPRRAPLSLSGSGKQHNQNQYSGKSADSNGSSNNSASAKNDNKLSASQKAEPTNNDAKESTPKDVKKLPNTEKKQPQQQPAVNNETAKKNEKVDEKKSQNGAGKAATNGGTKEKQQNGSGKQENGNGNASNAKPTNSHSNGNATAKSTSTSKSNEKTAAPAKEEAKSKEQKPVQNNEKNDKTSEKEKEKDKKKEHGPEKTAEKETRSRRHDTAAAETDKKQIEKTESIKSDDTKTDVSTPTSRSSAAQSKTSTTPTKGVDKSSGASTPTKAVERSSASQRTKTVTTVIDDVEMEPLAVEPSPVKPQKHPAPTAASVVPVPQPPAATSTPGKAPPVTQKAKLQAAAAKLEMPTKIQSTGSSPDRSSAPRAFTQIAGRRSIRPLTEYTPSKFEGNLQFRESYRRINTELDVSSTTNTSMNVTVGSEVPNNSSFSFFGRGRKRDRTPPPQSLSTMRLQTDADYSPPKRARLDMQTFFSVVSSPLTMLRSRFSRASIQSSTPMKLTSKLTANDEAEVQNVSGISIEEEINEGAESEEKTATEDVTVGKKTDDDATAKMDSPMKVDEKCSMEKGEERNSEGDVEKKSSDVHEVAAGVADTSVTSVKNKRCNVM
ncbi:neurofilament heavy polypeptide [Rhagoletis pomonella]|uniref:neurofilament heavy polypeptide n=1 Tax=Rhagoletis pomonella TaxID=28610 RepID=UPI00178032D7|nr:neurofilament heavy polypeptide [Rhagoletis pomonella]XP_036323649.1 neurofilament heavy polypeptide [Rhagoletis pomonella]